MLLASTVPRWREGEMDKARKREAEVKYLVPSPFFHHSSLPLHRCWCRASWPLSLAPSPPDFDLFVAPLDGDKESRSRKKKKNRAAERGGYTGEGGKERKVRKTCPSLHDPVHSPPTILTITLEGTSRNRETSR